jgi:hypothetical protein
MRQRLYRGRVSKKGGIRKSVTLILYELTIKKNPNIGTTIRFG